MNYSHAVSAVAWKWLSWQTGWRDRKAAGSFINHTTKAVRVAGDTCKIHTSRSFVTAAVITVERLRSASVSSAAASRQRIEMNNTRQQQQQQRMQSKCHSID